MSDERAEAGDALSRWLAGAGLETLDGIALLRDREDPVHLVLMDVVMPGMVGPEAWEQMRGLRPGLRVLFTSGYADDRYRQRLPSGAELLEKPFRAEELLWRVRKALD